MGLREEEERRDAREGDEEHSDSIDDHGKLVSWLSHESKIS